MNLKSSPLTKDHKVGTGFLRFSVITPVPPNETADNVVDSLKCMDYPQSSIELSVEAGRNPPAQRNLAALKATGDIIYFVDSDVQMSPTL